MGAKDALDQVMRYVCGAERAFQRAFQRFPEKEGGDLEPRELAHTAEKAGMNTGGCS